MIDSNGFGGGLVSSVGGGDDALVLTLIVVVDAFPVLITVSNLLLDNLVASLTVSVFLVVDELKEGLEVVETDSAGLELVEELVSLVDSNLWAKEDVTLVVVVLLAAELGADVEGCLFDPTTSFTFDGRSNFTVECRTAGFEVVVLLPLDLAATSILDLLVDSPPGFFVVVVFESSTNTTTVLGSFNKLFTLLAVLLNVECVCFEEEVELELAEPGLDVVEPVKSRNFMSEVLLTEPTLLSPSRTLLTTSLMSDISSSLS